MPRRAPLGRTCAALVTTALLGTGCPGSTPPPTPAKAPPRTLTVSVEAARVETVQRTALVFGTLHGDEEATISNRVTGRVRSISADVGDVVASGSVLLELEVEDFELALSASKRSLEATLVRLGTAEVPGDDFDVDKVVTVVRAHAQLENSKAHLARLEALGHKGEGFVSEQTIADARTDTAVATANLAAERLSVRALIAEAHKGRAELALAERRLADARLRTPEGTRKWAVAARLVSAGEYLKEGTAVFKVVASDPLKLRAAVPERFVSEIKVGLDATVRVDAYGARTFQGKVSRVNPSVDVVTRTFGVEVLVPNAEGLLRPGTFARAELLTRQEEVVTVPLEAIVSFAGITKVFVLEGDRARERIVTQGQRSGRNVEVKGLEKDARVLVRGQTVVADGTAVVVSGSQATPPVNVGNSTSEVKK